MLGPGDMAAREYTARGGVTATATAAAAAAAAAPPPDTSDQLDHLRAALREIRLAAEISKRLSGSPDALPALTALADAYAAAITALERLRDVLGDMLGGTQHAQHAQHAQHGEV